MATLVFCADITRQQRTAPTLSGVACYHEESENGNDRHDHLTSTAQGLVVENDERLRRAVAEQDVKGWLRRWG